MNNAVDTVPFYKKVISYTKSIIERIKDGFEMCSSKEHKERYFICQGCPLRDIKKDTCSLCGCDLWDKTKWKSSKCADKKNPKW